MNQTKIHTIANALGLLFVNCLLFTAFYLQFSLHELPCPLCMLQRACFVGLGLGMCMNLKIAPKAPHYGLMIIACILGFCISGIQVYIHLSPNDAGYGAPFLGLHLYAWASLIFMLAILACAIALLIDKGLARARGPSTLGSSMMYLFLLIIAANACATLLQCGFWACPPNPKQYILLATVL